MTVNTAGHDWQKVLARRPRVLARTPALIDGFLVEVVE